MPLAPASSSRRDGVGHVADVAVAGVGVDEDRMRRPCADGREALEDLAQAGQPDVGLARLPARRRVATQVDPREARRDGRDGLQRRPDAGQQERPVGCVQQGGKARSLVAHRDS